MFKRIKNFFNRCFDVLALWCCMPRRTTVEVKSISPTSSFMLQLAANGLRNKSEYEGYDNKGYLQKKDVMIARECDVRKTFDVFVKTFRLEIKDIDATYREGRDINLYDLSVTLSNRSNIDFDKLFWAFKELDIDMSITDSLQYSPIVSIRLTQYNDMDDLRYFAKLFDSYLICLHTPSRALGTIPEEKEEKKVMTIPLPPTTKEMQEMKYSLK